jgi:hypothetical protein
MIIFLCQKRMDSITSDSLQNMNIQIDCTPQVDMEFDTLEDALKHWKIMESK